MHLGASNVDAWIKRLEMSSRETVGWREQSAVGKGITIAGCGYNIHVIKRLNREKEEECGKESGSHLSLREVIRG